MFPGRSRVGYTSIEFLMLSGVPGYVPHEPDSLVSLVSCPSFSPRTTAFNKRSAYFAGPGGINALLSKFGLYAFTGVGQSGSGSPHRLCLFISMNP